MTDVKVVDASEIVRVVGAFAVMSGSLSRDEARDVGERLGWAVERDNSSRMDFVTRFPVSRPQAGVRYWDGEVAEVRVRLTDTVSDADDAQRAEIVAVARRLRTELKATYGAPVRSRAGRIPRYTWDLPNGGRFAISALSMGVELFVLQTRKADLEREEERLGIPGDRDPS